MRAARQREVAANQPRYERRRPEQTPLYRLVREHYETFAAEVDEHGASPPQFVNGEFEPYLEGAVLPHGFMRVRCDHCAHSGVRELAPALKFRRVATVLKAAASSSG